LNWGLTPIQGDEMPAPKRERDTSFDTSLDEFLAAAADAAPVARVHLLDCGPEEYGDALLIDTCLGLGR
jgi:hypothetical protein